MKQMLGKIYILFMLLMLLSTFLSGQEASNILKIQQQLDQVVKEQMEAQQIPGLALAILVDGKPFYLKGYGYSNLQTGERVSPTTLFGIGSCSKVMTAFAVMILMDEGKINISDSIRRYLPEAPLAWQNITIRELLSHTSGIPRHQGSYLPWSKTWSEIANTPLQFEPGSQVKYSNFGFIILSRLIEVVSGQSYNAFIYKRILKPRGMMQTSIPLESFPPELTIGYKMSKGGRPVQNTRHPMWSQMWGSGGIVSNIIDLAKWDIAMTAGAILKPKTYQLMWTPVMLSNQESSGWSLGWQISKLGDRKVASKNGGIAGYRTCIVRYLDDDISLIFLTNATSVHFKFLTQSIFQILKTDLF